MPSTFAALRHRDFRLYWIALIISAGGTWMQIVAQSLLVLRLSHGSAYALGVVALSQAAAFFAFALYGGSFADRMDRRRLLLITQWILLVLAATLGVLTATGLARIWMVAVLAFLSGAVLSFDQPTRAAFLPSLVPDEDLLSAVSLQTMVFTGASAIAPALAGLSILAISLAGNFFLNAASYVTLILTLVFIRPASARQGQARAIVPLAASIRSGLETVREDPSLLAALSGYAVLLFIAPSMTLLLPIFVDRIFGAGAGQLGWLLAAYGAGAVAGAVATGFASATRKGYVFLACFGVSVAALAALAMVRTAPVCAAVLFVLGAAQNGVSVITISSLQSHVAREMRGRMMSLNTLLIMGVRPLGDFPVSLLIGGLGVTSTVAVSALLIGGFGLYLGLGRQQVLKL